MPKYKLTNTYIVDAQDKADAIAIIQKKGSELLAYISLQEVAESKRTGWRGSLASQLFGKKK